MNPLITNCATSHPPQAGGDGIKPTSAVQSIIDQLRSTNIAPDEAIQSELQGLCHANLQHVHSLRRKLSDMRHITKALEDDLELSSDRVEALQCIVSPARRLLDRDVIGEIFKAVLDFESLRPLSFQNIKSTEVLDTIQQKRTPSPWVLSQVCSAWRSVAFQLPQLWSYISFSLDRYRETQPDGLERILITHVTRAGHLDLCVSLHSSEAVPFDHPALAILMQTATRWTSFSISFPSDGYYAFDYYTELTMPKLKALDVDIPRRYLDEVLMFAHTPALKSIVSSFPDFLDIFQPCAAWRNIEWTDRNLLHRTTFPLLKALDRRVLQITSLDCTTIGGLVDASDRAYVPSLRHLTIRGLGIARLLGHLEAPGLTSLKIRLPVLLIFRGPGFMGRVTPATASNLTQLSVSVPSTTDRDWLKEMRSMLATVPNVSSLDLKVSQPSGFEALCHCLHPDGSYGGRLLLPALSKLCIRARDGMHVSVALIDIIAYRRTEIDGLAKLHTVLVDYARYTDARVSALVIGSVAGFVDAGMDIEIVTKQHLPVV